METLLVWKILVYGWVGSEVLLNLSTRGQVGTSGNIMIPGITVGAGTGTRVLRVSLYETLWRRRPTSPA